MKRLIVAALVVASVAVAAGSAAAGTGGTKSGVVYNSVIPNGPPSNLPSVGAEAYAFNEFGNEITLAGTARTLTGVTVTLSSWACVQGSWFNHNCSTPGGSTFSMPVTLNLYNASTDGGLTPGSLITSVTQTFTIPYRPSASPQCTGAYAGEWYQPSSKTCFNGLSSNVTFNLPNVHVPDTVVYGISYNTSHYGPSPLGESTTCFGTNGGCPYDSLNIALSTQHDVTAGTDPDGDGTVWQNSPYAGEYCDGGLAGAGTFRLDSPSSACWNDGQGNDYVPAVQFKASNGG